MQGVTEFLGSAAMTQPLLIVLEDLHSADKGTLEMLEHVGRNLADKRLLIVGTYRDVEVDRMHPLSAALAELRRLPGFARLLLRGLNADEVRRLLSSIAGQEVPGVWRRRCTGRRRAIPCSCRRWCATWSRKG
jgi:predicted ATPase